MQKGEHAGSPLQDLVNRLVHYRILRHDAISQTYTAHPLVRNHYFALFTKSGASQEKAAHEQIKEYYLSIAGDTPQYPTLDDLKPLIEVVHHACQAGAHDDAFKIYWDRIRQGEKRVTIHQLGAYETELTLVQEFFPNSDTVQEPSVSEKGNRRFLVNAVGLCLMNLGRLREAVPIYERKNEVYEKTSTGYRNLADLHASLGALEASAEAAQEAVTLAQKAESKFNEKGNMGYLGWARHLKGQSELAGNIFIEAEKIEKENDSSVKYLYSLNGIQHADHLRRTNQSEYARRVTEANLQICEQQHWANQISLCHRALGDLDADADNHTSARAHYEFALKIARGISVRSALIEALLGRGRFYAKTSEFFKNSEVSQAFNNLNEALTYAVEGGYRIYEADIRVALAWAHLSPRPPSPAGKGVAEPGVRSAKAEAERALQMSTEMGYYWGKLDAGEVLEKMK